MIINGAKQLEPTAFDVVEKCDGGHCLMISRPQWLAEVLRRAAGEVIQAVCKQCSLDLERHGVSENVVRVLRSL